MFNQAIASFREGRLADAERLLLVLLQQSPNHFDSLHLLGIIARQTQRTDLAVELISRAIQQNGKNPAAHRHLADALVDLRRLPQAVTSYDAAIWLKPDFLEAHIGRGFALLELRQPAAALAGFDQAIALQGKNLAAHHGRAAALVALKPSRQAIECCDRTLMLYPNAGEAHMNRAAKKLPASCR